MTLRASLFFDVQQQLGVVEDKDISREIQVSVSNTIRLLYLKNVLYSFTVKQCVKTFEQHELIDECFTFTNFSSANKIGKIWKIVLTD